MNQRSPSSQEEELLGSFRKLRDEDKKVLLEVAQALDGAAYAKCFFEVFRVRSASVDWKLLTGRAA